MNADHVLRPWVAGLMFAALVISATFRGRAARRGGRVSRAGEGLALMIGLRLSLLLYFGGVIAWASDPALLAWAAIPLPFGLRVAGIVVAFVALGLQCWMFVNLGHNITDTVTVRKQATLVTHGPYRFMRHPLYSFGTLLLAGIFLATANAYLLVTAVVGIALVARRTPIEEAKLIERFGDAYRDYMRRTPRYWPWLRPAPNAMPPEPAAR